MANKQSQPKTGLRTIVRAEHAAKVARNRASAPQAMARVASAPRTVHYTFPVGMGANTRTVHSQFQA